MSTQAPAVVIGAGVVGCAVAHALAERGRPPVVLERARRSADGITSRNSGVVHGGLYHAPGSLKAKTCVRGRHLLEEWCERHDVPRRRCGKWIVGGRDDAPALEALLSNARACGVDEIDFADVEKLRADVPSARGEIALFCRASGIVDPIALTRSLQAAAGEAGASVITSTEVRSLELHGDLWRVDSSRGTVDTPLVVNAAGLDAGDIARLAQVDRYRLHPCRGDYFRLASRWRLPTLLYPVRPRGAPGLGVHVTIDLAGGVRLGPDARWIDRRDDFSPPPDEEALRAAFAEAAGRILSGVQPTDLTWDSCGIRPKLRAPDDPEERDFVVAMDRPGLVNLVGIESPGLTAALALAEEVMTLFALS